MMLCRWNDRWVLAYGAPSPQHPCGIVTGDWDNPAHLGFIFEDRTVSVPDMGIVRPFHIWQRVLETGAGLRCYPGLRYCGAFVLPELWKIDTQEPVIKLRGGFTQKALPRGVDEDEFVKQRMAEGWTHEHGEGFWAYIHVDDPNLEKIEGPPPAGAF